MFTWYEQFVFRCIAATTVKLVYFVYEYFSMITYVIFLQNINLRQKLQQKPNGPSLLDELDSNDGFQPEQQRRFVKYCVEILGDFCSVTGSRKW